MRKYDHKKIERTWQRTWEKSRIYKTPDATKGKKNFYLLTEFPYPSGNLHVGHWYAFSVPDILARCMRMQGKNVLYPVGFDAFGLPAENAAIKNKLNPRTWTERNIAYMKKQIRSMGTCFDWSREIITCDPAYYKWTQWQFVQFFKKGLAYQKETSVNWCPKDKTVLANEQVVNGRCERCDAEVVQRQMLQWNLKITDYADRLIDDLEGLDWPEQIKESQRNWIGRSEGAEIDLRLTGNVKDDSRFLILHGREAKPTSIFIPWLREELEKAGHEVEVPQLPNTNEPNAYEQADFILKNCKLDERTVIIGHSSGGITAMRVLEHDVTIRRAVLVATPYSGKFLDGKVRPSVNNSVKKGFDFEKIKKNARSFIVLPDIHDDRVPFSDAESYAQHLGAILLRGRSSKNHFMEKREPDILMAALPTIRVFTTRADTLFGGTYLVLAPEHPWVTLALKHGTVLNNNDEVKAYVGKAAKKTELERQESKEKSGVELKGVKAINPASQKEIPIWIADFVIGTYGTGAVFADAHDERDWEFAKKYRIPLKETLEPVIIRNSSLDALRNNAPWIERSSILAVVKHWSENKYLALHYRPSDTRGLVSGGREADEDPIPAAKREIAEESGYTSAEFIQRLGEKVHCKYFSVARKVNVFSHFTPLLFKLKDDSRAEVSKKEADEHEVKWLTKGEMDEFINRDDMRIVWQRVHGEMCYAGKGILYDSGEFSGLTSEDAIPKIGAGYGRIVKQYHLRDWVVSRQRYWGVPIPIIRCKRCGPQAVPDKDLPVKLPEVKDYLPDGRGKSPLAKATKWIVVRCPKCKGKAERETDTLDTFVDSSWYFLRYTDPKNKRKFADAKKMKRWMPVDFYSGGPEHTTMHVLYSRFWHKALYDLGLVKDSEPYIRRQSHGLILGPDSQKMSKSHGNVIDPDELVERLGADTVRLYLAFIGPYNEVGSYPWNPDGVVGVRRFLERAWKIQYHLDFVNPNLDLRNPNIESLLHKTIKKVGDDIAALKFNTAISALMILLNALEREKSVGKQQWNTFLLLLAPFAPHIAEELWSGGNRGSIHEKAWPSYDADKLQDLTITIAIQINGKTRGQATLQTGADKAATEKTARGVVAGRLQGKTVKRTVVVPGRLINFVLEE